MCLDRHFSSVPDTAPPPLFCPTGTLVMIIQSMAYSIYLVMLQWKLRTFPYPITIFYNAMKCVCVS